MIRKISSLLALTALFIHAETVNDNNSYIVYSPEEMQAHKRQCSANIRSNPANINDRTYQMQRALFNISGDDADYIPKIVGAGEIFNEGELAYQLMHNGVKIILNSYYNVQWLTDVIYGLKGHHEPQEEKCFYEVLKYIPENATMVELGAYWGYYSLWFASRIPNAINYLIEPDPHRLEVGKKNFVLNNKIGIFKRAFVGPMKDNEPNIIGAEQISLDDFINNEEIEHIHILHSDIQGAELDMLNSAVKHLNSIDYFFISTHGTPVHRACLQFFKTHDIPILAECNDIETCGCDGLIVAKRKGVAGPDHISIRKYR